MRNRLISVVAVAGLAVMSCSGDDSATETTATTDLTVPSAEPQGDETEVTEPATTETEVTEPATPEPTTTETGITEPATAEPETTVPVTTHAVEMMECEQVAMYVPLEPSEAHTRVAADVELIVVDDRVTSLFLVHDCADTAVDGRSSGAAHVIAQWLPITGPDEVRDGPQFEGAPVLPTRYWEPVYTATDNPTMQQLMLAADLDMSLVDSMSFEMNRPDTAEGFYSGHNGQVDAMDAEPVVSYGWVTVNNWGQLDLPRSADQPTGFVHVVGDLELEAVGNIDVADLPFCHLVEADGPNEPMSGPIDPETLGPDDPTGCLLLTFEHLLFEPTT